jgi:hypothetical protein
MDQISIGEQPDSIVDEVSKLPTKTQGIHFGMQRPNIPASSSRQCNRSYLINGSINRDVNGNHQWQHKQENKGTRSLG